MPRLRPRAVLTAQDLPRTQAAVPDASGGVVLGDAPAAAAAPTASDPGGNNYVGRLITYIPAEMIAVYQTVQGFFPEAASTDAAKPPPAWLPTMLIWLGLGLLLLTPVWIRVSTANKGEPAAWHQIANSTLAFLIWLLMAGNPIVRVIPNWDPRLGSVAMVLAVLLVFPLVEALTKPKPPAA